MLDPDSKWPIPERFRASLDVTDEQAHALLLKCDAEQKRLGEKINAPFTRTSALETAMSKAMITIESLERVKGFGELTDDQKEILAEAFAAIGRYDLAADTTLLGGMTAICADTFSTFTRKRMFSRSAKGE